MKSKQEMEQIFTYIINNIEFNAVRVYPGHGFTTFKISFEREQGRNTFYMISLWNKEFNINQKFGLPQEVIDAEKQLAQELLKIISIPVTTANDLIKTQ